MFGIDFDNNECEKLVVSLNGDLDINSVKEFQEQVIREYSELDKDLVFDLKGLEYIDSTGLGAIITVYKDVKEKNKKLSIINANKNVKKLFYITELDSVFEIGE